MILVVLSFPLTSDIKNSSWLTNPHILGIFLLNVTLEKNYNAVFLSSECKGLWLLWLGRALPSSYHIVELELQTAVRAQRELQGDCKTHK